MTELFDQEGQEVVDTSTEVDAEGRDLVDPPPPPKPDNKPWWLVEPPRPSDRPQWIKGAWSASRFKKLQQCSRAHDQRYRLKIKEPYGVDALIGNAVHGALEDAGRRRLHRNRHGPLPTTPSVNELLHLLEFQEEVRPDSGHGSEVLARSRAIIENMEIPSFEGIAAVEELWKFYATPSLLLAGYADLVQTYTRHRRDKFDVLVVTDYKTGESQLPSREELERDPQAGFYLIAYKRAFPWAQIRFRIRNVTLNEEVWVDYSRQIEEITLSFVRSAHRLWTTGDKTPTTGPHCEYCFYRRDCPAFDKILRDQEGKRLAGVEAMGLDELLAAMHEAKTIAVIADRRRKDAADRIKELMPAGQRSYSNGAYKATKKRRRTPRMRSAGSFLSELHEILSENGMQELSDWRGLLDEFGSISKNKLSAFLSTLPESLRPDIDKLVERHRTMSATPAWIEVKAEAPLF